MTQNLFESEKIADSIGQLEFSFSRETSFSQESVSSQEDHEQKYWRKNEKFIDFHPRKTQRRSDNKQRGSLFFTPLSQLLDPGELPPREPTHSRFGHSSPSLKQERFTGSLPVKESPMRHGKYLVRMFDGNMSETQEEQRKRLEREEEQRRKEEIKRRALQEKLERERQQKELEEGEEQEQKEKPKARKYRHSMIVHCRTPGQTPFQALRDFESTGTPKQILYTPSLKSLKKKSTKTQNDKPKLQINSIDYRRASKSITSGSDNLSTTNSVRSTPSNSPRGLPHTPKRSSFFASKRLIIPSNKVSRNQKSPLPKTNKTLHTEGGERRPRTSSVKTEYEKNKQAVSRILETAKEGLPEINQKRRNTLRAQPRDFLKSPEGKRHTIVLSARQQMLALHEQLKMKNNKENTQQAQRKMRNEAQNKAIQSIQKLQQKVNNFDPQDAELSELLFRIEQRKRLERKIREQERYSLDFLMNSRPIPQ